MFVYILFITTVVLSMDNPFGGSSSSDEERKTPEYKRQPQKQFTRAGKTKPSKKIQMLEESSDDEPEKIIIFGAKNPVKYLQEEEDVKPSKLTLHNLEKLGGHKPRGRAMSIASRASSAITQATAVTNLTFMSSAGVEKAVRWNKMRDTGNFDYWHRSNEASVASRGFVWSENEWLREAHGFVGETGGKYNASVAAAPPKWPVDSRFVETGHYLTDIATHVGLPAEFIEPDGPLMYGSRVLSTNSDYPSLLHSRYSIIRDGFLDQHQVSDLSKWTPFLVSIPQLQKSDGEILLSHKSFTTYGVKGLHFLWNDISLKSIENFPLFNRKIPGHHDCFMRKVESTSTLCFYSGLLAAATDADLKTTSYGQETLSPIELKANFYKKKLRAQLLELYALTGSTLFDLEKAQLTLRFFLYSSGAVTLMPYISNVLQPFNFSYYSSHYQELPYLKTEVKVSGESMEFESGGTLITRLPNRNLYYTLDAPSLSKSAKVGNRGDYSSPWAIFRDESLSPIGILRQLVRSYTILQMATRMNWINEYVIARARGTVRGVLAINALLLVKSFVENELIRPRYNTMSAKKNIELLNIDWKDEWITQYGSNFLNVKTEVEDLQKFYKDWKSANKTLANKKFSQTLGPIEDIGKYQNILHLMFSSALCQVYNASTKEQKPYFDIIKDLMKKFDGLFDYVKAPSEETEEEWKERKHLNAIKSIIHSYYKNVIVSRIHSYIALQQVHKVSRVIVSIPKDYHKICGSFEQVIEEYVEKKFDKIDTPFHEQDEELLQTAYALFKESHIYFINEAFNINLLGTRLDGLIADLTSYEYSRTNAKIKATLTQINPFSIRRDHENLMIGKVDSIVHEALSELKEENVDGESFIFNKRGVSKTDLLYKMLFDSSFMSSGLSISIHSMLISIGLIRHVIYPFEDDRLVLNYMLNSTSSDVTTIMRPVEGGTVILHPYLDIVFTKILPKQYTAALFLYMGYTMNTASLMENRGLLRDANSLKLAKKNKSIKDTPDKFISGLIELKKLRFLKFLVEHEGHLTVGMAPSQLTEVASMFYYPPSIKSSVKKFIGSMRPSQIGYIQYATQIMKLKNNHAHGQILKQILKKSPSSIDHSEELHDPSEYYNDGASFDMSEIKENYEKFFYVGQSSENEAVYIRVIVYGFSALLDSSLHLPGYNVDLNRINDQDVRHLYGIERKSDSYRYAHPHQYLQEKVIKRFVNPEKDSRLKKAFRSVKRALSRKSSADDLNKSEEDTSDIDSLVSETMSQGSETSVRSSMSHRPGSDLKGISSQEIHHKEGAVAAFDGAQRTPRPWLRTFLEVRKYFMSADVRNGAVYHEMNTIVNNAPRGEDNIAIFNNLIIPEAPKTVKEIKANIENFNFIAYLCANLRCEHFKAGTLSDDDPDFSFSPKPELCDNNSVRGTFYHYVGHTYLPGDVAPVSMNRNHVLFELTNPEHQNKSLYDVFIQVWNPVLLQKVSESDTDDFESSLKDLFRRGLTGLLRPGYNFYNDHYCVLESEKWEISGGLTATKDVKKGYRLVEERKLGPLKYVDDFQGVYLTSDNANADEHRYAFHNRDVINFPDLIAEIRDELRRFMKPSHLKDSVIRELSERYCSIIYEKFQTLPFLDRPVEPKRPQEKNVMNTQEKKEHLLKVQQYGRDKQEFLNKMDKILDIKNFTWELTELAREQMSLATDVRIIDKDLDELITWQNYDVPIRPARN